MNDEEIDLIERAAISCDMDVRRSESGSLEIWWKGMWIPFNPIANGADVDKLLYMFAKKTDGVQFPREFRLKLVEGIVEHDYSV